jgi:hypothetical protein
MPHAATAFRQELASGFLGCRIHKGNLRAVVIDRMRANDPAPTAASRHGAYICIAGIQDLAALPVDALTEQLGLMNEANGAPPSRERPEGASPLDGAPAPTSVAFLRRVAVGPGAIKDEGLMAADVIVHVSAAKPEPVSALRLSLTELIASRRLRIIGGAVLPLNYTGNRMHDFAYAHRVLQRPAAEAPNAFLIPLSKTAAWWRKCWMERHTYFLPRYDADGRRVADGHALAAEQGIPYLLRRSYRQFEEPAPAGVYDFINYFECADADIVHFQATCAALRDVARNPEWLYVREGPTWHGRRAASWAELFNN